MFILSDGAPSIGQEQNVDAILKLVRRMNLYQKIRINTVFTGEDDGGADFMRRLAEQNHGVFVRDDGR